MPSLQSMLLFRKGRGLCLVEDCRHSGRTRDNVGMADKASGNRGVSIPSSSIKD